MSTPPAEKDAGRQSFYADEAVVGRWKLGTLHDAVVEAERREFLVLGAASAAGVFAALAAALDLAPGVVGLFDDHRVDDAGEAGGADGERPAPATGPRQRPLLPRLLPNWPATASTSLPASGIRFTIRTSSLDRHEPTA